MNDRIFALIDGHSRSGWNMVRNLLRWFLLGLAFIFLLTGLFALNEVMNFQRRVAELVSDGNRARQVLVTLHERLESEEEIPEPDEDSERLPFAVMAVQLGSVESAVQDLHGFGWKPDGVGIPTVNGTGVGASNSEEAGANQEDEAEAALTRYAFATNDLTADLDEIKGLLEKKGPAPQVIASIEALRAELTRVERIGTVALKEMLDQLKQSIITDSPPDQESREELIAQVAKTEKELTSNGSMLTGPTATPQGKSDPPKDFGLALADMKEGLAHLEDMLADEYGQGFLIADAFASELNQMQGLAERLQEFEPSTYRPPEAENELEDSEAAAQYEQTVGELLGALDRLKQRLEPEARQIQIASIIARGDDDPEAAAYKAELILDDFDALSRFNGILGWFTLDSVDPRVVATLSADSLTLLFVMMIGAIGSLIYVAQYNLKPLIQGHGLTDPPDRGFLYVIFRIFFGVVMALAVYLLVKAGQLAFGGAADANVGDEINRPIIAVVALLAGLLAWHALSAIESKGATWFGGHTRRDLWATGLDHALKQAKREVTELAHHVGRSVEQVERWLMFRDRVTPEMQDRIRTWLDRSLSELFSDAEPKNLHAGRAMWATGLKGMLDDRKRALDLKTLAELLGEPDTKRVEGWRDLKLQVAPPLQWRLVDVLGARHALLFDANAQDRAALAVGLRAAREVKKLRVHALADLIGIDDKRVHGWQELDEPVPVQWQDKLIEVLGMGWTTLFTRNGLRNVSFYWARGLGQRLTELGLDAAWLAKQVDVEVERVEAWMAAGRKPLYEATAKRVAEALDSTVDDLFEEALIHTTTNGD